MHQQSYRLAIKTMVVIGIMVVTMDGIAAEAMMTEVMVVGTVVETVTAVGTTAVIAKQYLLRPVIF
jgi:hypothetical protein